MSISHPAVSNTQRQYLSPDQVCELIPGMTRAGLAQLRFHASGPKYFKPSPRKVVYELNQVLEWLESTSRQGTAPDAA